jgi:cytochrome P450
MNAHMTHPNETLLPWTDPDFRAYPFPWYDVLRRDAPVYLDPNDQNTYVISRYRDVVRYGKHPSLSNVAPAWVVRGPWGLFKDSIIVKDPPEHTTLRRHSNRWFTPKLTEQWAEAAAEEVNRVLDDLGPGGVTEGYRNLAVMPAHFAMCRALGLPNDGYDTGSAYMRDAANGLRAVVTEEEEARCREAFSYLLDRVAHYIAQTRANPQPGAVASWIEMAAAGLMTEVQLTEAVLLFWATGTPNAAYLITGGLETFARQPEMFELWRSAADKRPAILNELARLFLPELSFDRFTTEPIEIEGTVIPPESRLRFLIASANRDPVAFADPHKFDINRSAETPPHFAFGLGVHSCPGMNIAQAETIAVFNTLASRVKRIELAGAPVHDHDDRFSRYLRLPVRLVM